LPDSTYFADGVGSEPEAERLTLLESIFDPGTVETLTATGVEPGWRCLVPGAGHGSIARWLAHQVGPTGRVVATDIDTRFLESSASTNLEVRQHDLLEDPLEDDYDLVHARALLVHLVGDQVHAIGRLVDAVRPGGWIAIEEYDTANIGSADPAHPGHEAFNQSVAAEFDAISEQVDLWSGRHVAAILNRHPSLKVVDIDMSAAIVRGGSAYPRFLAETYQVALAALARSGKIAGLSAEALTEVLSDASFQLVTPLRYRMLAQRLPETL
jgi:trans-aconitate methyltransferase